jgi:tripartite-type tricarboxylate transporter receptor subunit TctC
LLPDVPTFDEAGVKGFHADAWYGPLAPAGTPEPVLAKLREAATQFSNAPESAEKLKSLGMEPQNLCADAFAGQLDREVREYKELAHELNLQNN